MIKDDFMKKILICMFTFLLLFTIAMVIVFCYLGEVPDSLIVAVFGACAGEYSICGLIKNAKEREKTERMKEGFIENCDEYNFEEFYESEEDFIRALEMMNDEHDGDIEEEAID